MATKKVVFRLLLLLVLIASCFSISPKATSADALKWSRVTIPANGLTGQWKLAEGSDLHSLTLASDGTFYCGANPNSTPYRLFKSTDSGSSWSYTGRVEDTIVDIAILPTDSNTVYYATSSKVFKSTDSAINFELLAANPGGSGTGNVVISSLDVTSANGINYIAVGLRDNDPSQFAGIYTLIENQPFNWQINGSANWDVFEVSFSPRFAEDHQITAVGTDEVNTIIASGTAGGSWGLNAGEARLAGITPLTAGIAFPEDYASSLASGKCIQYLSLNSGSGRGGVYRLQGQAELSLLTPLIINMDVASLAVNGNASQAKLLVGSATSNLTFYSENAGANWLSSIKPPTGDSGTEVLMAGDFSTGGPAYAVTSGVESAFSISWDGGTAWNQTGLVDTRISTILDLTISPGYSQDTRLFLLTDGLQNSLWYSSNGGSGWQRIYSTSPTQSDRINMILLSPRYSDNQNIFLAGTSSGNPVFWKSEDNGHCFIQHASVDPDTEVPVNIDTWAITSANVLFIGSSDGDHGMVYQTAVGSLSYIDKSTVGSQVINSLALSPDYDNDHTILAGNTFGSVFFSDDNGTVFEPLPFDAAESPLSGSISLAFDTGYPQNQTLYAASDTADRGIFRRVIGKSLSWESIDQNLPDKARIGKIVPSANGILYGLNLQPVDNTLSKGGLERSLDPSASPPLFETLTSGLEDGITLNKLWVYGNKLWTVDVTNNRLLLYTDTLVSPITLASPAADASGLDASNTTLYWKPVEGDTTYHWQVSMAADFSTLVDKFNGLTSSSLVTLTSLNLNTTYYWRVRASQPVVSPWSTVRSFDTLKITAPTLSQPSSSGSTSIEPIFKWSACEGAAQYELMASLNDDFSALVISRICSSNVWKSDAALNYNTSYYWKVRGVGEKINSDWSAVSIFTTETTPAPTPGLSTPKPSSPISSVSALIEPVFKWSTVIGASSYELVVSLNGAFSPLLIDEFCDSDAWKCTTALDFNTTYYWKVRAVRGELLSLWSDVNAFTTRTEPSNSSSGGSGSSAQLLSPTPSPTPSPTTTHSPSATSIVQSPLLTVPLDSQKTPAPLPATTTPASFSPSSTYLPKPFLKAGDLDAVLIPAASSTIATVSPLATFRVNPDSTNPVLYIILGCLAIMAVSMIILMVLMVKKNKHN